MLWCILITLPFIYCLINEQHNEYVQYRKEFKGVVDSRIDLEEIVCVQETIYFGTFLGMLPPITNDAVMPFRT